MLRRWPWCRCALISVHKTSPLLREPQRLVFLTSQGDHRLYHLLPWVEEHVLTLQACLGKSVRPLDFHDDRLADVLDALARPSAWEAFEADLNGHTVRVYDLAPALFRIDT